MSRLMKNRLSKVEATESNEKESYLHSGMNVVAYACLVSFGASNQREWLSDAILEKAESEGLGKDPKTTASVFQGMKHWLLNSKVGRAGGNKANLKELAEFEKTAEEVYFGKAAAKGKTKTKAKAAAETPATGVEVKA